MINSKLQQAKDCTESKILIETEVSNGGILPGPSHVGGVCSRLKEVCGSGDEVVTPRYAEVHGKGGRASSTL
jgi:hypothetical protein